jgi:glucan phosphoethanolaminetransferase (alkaline phosphatase superfamily)
MTERSRVRGLIVIKAVLITAGLALTNHSVIERVLFFVRWKQFFPLGVFAGIWLSTLLALIYLAFAPPRITRSVWTAVVVLSSFGGDLFFRLTGDRLSLGAVEAMEFGFHFSVAELTRTALFYQRYVVSALFGSSLLYAGLRLSVPTAKLAAARILLCLPLAPYGLLVGLVLFMAGNRTAEDVGMPQQFYPASVLTVFLLSNADDPIKAPIGIGRATDPKARHIVFIIDESVRGDYVDLDGRLGTTPYLRSRASEIVDFGLVVAGSNCSNGANAILRLGANPRRLDSKDPPVLTNPSIWKYATAAGFQTNFLDGQGIAEFGYNYLNREERSLIDNVVSVPDDDVDASDTDFFLADRVAELLTRARPQFVLVNKRGAHFPYAATYPERGSVFEPALRSTDSTGDVIRLRNSYKNAIRWNVDAFFQRLLASTRLDDAVVVYTSDHGQNLLDDGTPVTHCRRLTPLIQEAVVPLMVFTEIQSLRTAFQRSAVINQHRASGFQIFPTLLTLMGFAEGEVRDTYYDDLFVFQDTPLGFTSGPIAGVHRRPANWNSRAGLADLLSATSQ